MNTDDKMTVVRDYPPNYVAICAAFPWVAGRKGILFAWDMTIFNPDGVQLTPSLHAHEQVHSIQQAGNPEAWWTKYLDSAEFRYLEEVKAHICEYANIYEHEPRRSRRRLHLSDIAERLAGDLYGNLTTKEAAIRLLKTGARVLLAPQPQGSLTHDQTA